MHGSEGGESGSTGLSYPYVPGGVKRETGRPAGPNVTRQLAFHRIQNATLTPRSRGRLRYGYCLVAHPSFASAALRAFASTALRALIGSVAVPAA